MRGKGQPLICTRHMAEGSYSPCTKSHFFHLNQQLWLSSAIALCQVEVMRSSLSNTSDCLPTSTSKDVNIETQVVHLPCLPAKEIAHFELNVKAGASCIILCWMMLTWTWLFLLWSFFKHYKLNTVSNHAVRRQTHFLSTKNEVSHHITWSNSW